MKKSESGIEKIIDDNNENSTIYDILSAPGADQNHVSGDLKASGNIFEFKSKQVTSTPHKIAKTDKKMNNRILFPTNRADELIRLNNGGMRVESHSKRRRFLLDRIGKTVKKITIRALDLRETIKWKIRQSENYPAKLPPEFLNAGRNIRLKGIEASSNPNIPEKIVKPENQPVHPAPARIGQMLVKKGIINAWNLREAVKRQSEEPDKYLGQILSEMGLPQSRIMKGIYYGNKRKKLGDILVEQGIITAEQLDYHLLRQKHLKNKGERAYLGDLLIESRTISEENYIKALSAHFSMPIVSLSDYTVSPDLQKVLGEQYAARNRFVVLSNSQMKVTVATADPHLSAFDYLEKAIPKGKDILFRLARNSEIENCLGKIYDS